MNTTLNLGEITKNNDKYLDDRQTESQLDEWKEDKQQEKCDDGG